MDEYLPPVVINLVVNDAEALAGLAGFKAAVADTTSSVGSSAGRMSGAVGAAEKGVEAESKGFASRMAMSFESMGNSMGAFGVPFGNSIKKVGYAMKEGEAAGKGFSASLGGIARIASGVGLAIAAGIGIAAVKAADNFDVAQTRLRQAVENTGRSFASVETPIKATEKRLTDFGFTTTETAQALGTLTVSTHNPTKAIGEMTLAMDLSRYKHISLAQAAETLAKVNAGSLRPLMQLGIQLDVGSLKLSAAVKATEALAKAKQVLKGAEENMVVAAKKGAEEHAAALQKVEAAESALKAAQETLKSDTGGVTSAQEALKTAQNGVTEAAQKQKQAIKEASAALKAAEEAAREAAQTGAKSIEGAKRNLSNLEKERAKESNEQTIKKIENEEKVATGSTLAALQQQKAQLEASDKSIEAGKKEQQMQEAHSAITEAEATAHKNNKHALDAVRQAHEKLAQAHREALSNSKENVAAAHAVTQAQRGLSSAEEKLGRDQEAAGRASQALAAAQRAAAQPPKALAEAHKKLVAAQEAVSAAEKRLQKDHAATGQVMEALEKKIGGTAAAFGHTLAGQTDIAKAKLNEMAVSIGERLIPALLKLLEATKVITHALKPLWQGFVEGVEWLGRAAANLDIAWERNWGKIRSITETIFKVLLFWFVTGPIKMWSAIIGFLGKLVGGFAHGMSNLVNLVAEGIGGVIHFFASLPVKIWNFMIKIVNDMVSIGAKIVHALVEGITSAPGAIINAVKGLFHGIPVIGGALSAIGLAEGGIVTKPTLALVGEAGEEAVIPLKGKNVSPSGIRPLSSLPSSPSTASAPVSAPSSAGGLHVGELNVYGPDMSPSQMIQELYLKLRPMLQGA